MEALESGAAWRSSVSKAHEHCCSQALVRTQANAHTHTHTDGPSQMSCGSAGLVFERPVEARAAKARTMMGPQQGLEAGWASAPGPSAGRRLAYRAARAATGGCRSSNRAAENRSQTLFRAPCVGALEGRAAVGRELNSVL